MVVVEFTDSRTDREGAQRYDIKRVVVVSSLYHNAQYSARKDVSVRLRPVPNSAPLTEPNLITFDFGATADSDRVLSLFGKPMVKKFQ